MRRALQGLAVLLLVTVAGGGCLPTTVESFHFCGRMLYSFNGIVRSGTAEYRVRWVSNGVEYDSDYYGAPTAEIDKQGWACFHGGVGYPVAVKDFKLKSLTVKVRDGQGRALAGRGTHLQWEFRKNTRAFHAWGKFELELVRESEPELATESELDAMLGGMPGLMPGLEPDFMPAPVSDLAPDLVIDQRGEPYGDAVGGGQGVVP